MGSALPGAAQARKQRPRKGQRGHGAHQPQGQVGMGAQFRQGHIQGEQQCGRKAMHQGGGPEAARHALAAGPQKQAEKQAAQIKKLKTKQAKSRQAVLLCETWKRALKGGK